MSFTEVALAGMPRRAHKEKWYPSTMKTFARQTWSQEQMSVPPLSVVLELWPQKYDEMKEWPAELLPETHAPVRRPGSARRR